MNLRETFNFVIANYDYARPLYPKKLFDDIAAFSNLKPNNSILEVGAGTGQATQHYINGQYNLTALEIGKDQVAFLEQKYPTLNVECIPFEDFLCEKNSLDLIFSATAFHWIDAQIGYPKAHELLKHDGTLAVYWHNSSVTRFMDKMHIEIRKICEKYDSDLYQGKTIEELEEIHQNRLKQITIGGLFPKPYYKEYEWVDYYDAKKYIALLNTYSSFQMLELKKRTSLLNDIKHHVEKNGGVVEVPQKVKLYLTKKN